MDVLAVERRDEAALEPGRDLPVDLVATLLERLDLGDPLVEPVVAREHRLERAGGRQEVLGVLDERGEELLVTRDQADHRWHLAGGRR